jgi:hypothetical protein
MEPHRSSCIFLHFPLEQRGLVLVHGLPVGREMLAARKCGTAGFPATNTEPRPRPHDRPAVWRHRIGPRHHPQARPHDGRRRHGDERAGQRLSLHGAAAGRGRYLSKAGLRCKSRKGGAAASGLSLALSMAWHCAQCSRARLNPRRVSGCARAGPLNRSMTGAMIRDILDVIMPSSPRAWRFCVGAIPSWFASTRRMVATRLSNSIGLASNSSQPRLCARALLGL